MTKETLHQVDAEATRLKKDYNKSFYDGADNPALLKSLEEGAQRKQADASFTQGLVDQAVSAKERGESKVALKFGETEGPAEPVDNVIDRETETRNGSIAKMGEYTVRALETQSAINRRVAPTVEAAAQHFNENEAAYHDLAVIDAYKDGVQVNVEQPLEVGVKQPLPEQHQQQ